MLPTIKNEILKTRELMDEIYNNDSFLNEVQKIITCCTNALSAGKKILFAGNGGSAADSQHLAAELVSRLKFDRPALRAISLTVDTSALTAIGNDYGYKYVFSRQIAALGDEGDVFFAISTSGNSENILTALQEAQQRKLITVGFTGKSGGKMKDMCTHILCIPSQETPKIQEGHILLGHIICECIESALFSQLKQKAA